MRIFQPVQSGFQPLHRDTAQVDNIAAHSLFIGGDQRAHDVLIIQNGLGFRYDALAHLIIKLVIATHDLPAVLYVFSSV